MKKIISLLLILLLVSSCAKKPDTADLPLASSGNDVADTENECPFAAQYIRLYRTEGYSDDIADGITVCHSPDDIDAFAEGKFDRDYDTLEYSDGQASFNTLTAKYDGEYFRSNLLIICKVTEPSGNNRHKVEKLTDKGVYIDRIIPESGDCDMADWAILVEAERFDANGVDLYLDGQNVTGTPATVKVYGGITSLSIHIPEGWEYRENRFVSEEEEYGIYFKPKGENGELYLNYQAAFGVCGTGLETEQITVAGYECSKMTWDGKEMWDIISFPTDYGNVLVSNMGAEGWLGTRADEVLDILDSIKIETPTLSAERAKQLALAEFGEEYDGYIMSDYDLLRDTYTITFRKDGADHGYTVYSTGTVKPIK